MKTSLKTWLSRLHRYSGLLSAEEMLYHWTGHSCVSILVLHRVTDEIPADGLTIGCARFRDLCRILAQHFHVVPLGEIFRLARSGHPLPRRTVAITFDDCYRDNLDAAHVLAEHGLPATFFIPTAFVGTDHVFPWDRSLQRMPNLAWEDVRHMQQLGFEIGSHTVTHPDMGTISTEQVWHELVESKAVLEDRLGSPVRWLAYPFGGLDNFRADCLPLLQQAGYEGGVSSYGGRIHRGMRSIILRRVPVPSFSSNLLLEIYLSGCLRWYFDLKRCLGLSEKRLASWEGMNGDRLSATGRRRTIDADREVPQPIAGSR
ncbi:MAG TPA: polysaccharide deacetylase family protein [Gemmataceae bacterium]|nr:polysaccharide deacetylase family protein [Gemmataceae bacterium]